MAAPNAIQELIESQLKEWDLAAANYKGLEEVRSKSLQFNGFEILVQFNPKRIISSAAKVDAKSIEARPCFLCSANRPQQQQGLPFKETYTILVNPFPIFPKHLTIPLEAHTDQLIDGHFEDMLDLAAFLPGYVVFYNGPKCGASAPDHFHFQAGSKGFLPIEKDFHEASLCRPVSNKNNLTVFEWESYARTAITLQSQQKESICSFFVKVYAKLKQLQPVEKEPMMNILAYVKGDTWVVHIFPRILHRPKQYFLEGAGQILLSPASVDMGGVFITPREEDFIKIGASDVADILAQVSMDNKTLKTLILQD